jgi:hypothetical protein
MDQKSFIVYNGIVVPAAALRQQQQNDKYGHIEGLSNEELADPDEIERCILRDELEPVLLLAKPESERFNPAWNFSVDADFDAFASVDFERTCPEFNKARYKADKLEEERKEVLLTVVMLNERIKSKFKYKLFLQVLKGVIDIDDILNWDMWQFARYCLRAVRLKKQVKELRERSERERQKKADAFWRSMGC